MPWRSAPTARPSSPAADDRRRGSGTPPPASPSAAMQHRGQVNAVAFSPDGKAVLTGSMKHGAALGRRHRPARRPALAHRRHVERPWRSAPTARPSSPAAETDGAALGRRHRPAHRPPWSTRARSRPWRSAPTARPSSPAARTRRRGSGTPPPASPSAAPLAHQGDVSAVAFSPDGKAVLTGSQTGRRALGRRDRPAPRAALEHQGRSWPWRSAPTARPSSPAARTGRRGSGTPPPASPSARPWASGRGRCRGVQPRRQDRPHRRRGQDGAALGRRHRPAPRPASGASRLGLGRGVQPRRQDRPHRQLRQDGAALGRRHRPAHRPRPWRTRARSWPWRSAPTARPSSPAA